MLLCLKRISVIRHVYMVFVHILVTWLFHTHVTGSVKNQNKLFISVFQWIYCNFRFACVQLTILLVCVAYAVFMACVCVPAYLLHTSRCLTSLPLGWQHAHCTLPLSSVLLCRHANKRPREMTTQPCEKLMGWGKGEGGVPLLHQSLLHHTPYLTNTDLVHNCLYLVILHLLCAAS